MEQAVEFFNLFLHVRCPRVCVENPVPHGYAANRMLAKYNQIIHPWQFGHLEQKATCLWLKGLPELKETANVRIETLSLPYRERQRIQMTPGSRDQAKKRSKTYPGIAKAMAEQWGR